MRIYKHQVERFTHSALQEFEDELINHLKNFSPRHVAVLGEGGVRQAIRLGINRANAYGFAQHGSVRLYIELMFIFGSFFDTDPQLPWATEILNDNRLQYQSMRADRLYAHTIDYIERVVGSHREYAINGLRKFNDVNLENVLPHGEALDSAAARVLESIYPQKCSYMGTTALRKLIQVGIDAAQRHSAISKIDITLFVALVFIFGHGFEHDPLFPWIFNSLKFDETEVDSVSRFERTRKMLRLYLSNSLQYLETMALS